jgi:hypothetical protein
MEGTWGNIDHAWDLIHVRTLLGSVQSWDDLYEKIHRLERLSYFNILQLVLWLTCNTAT